MLIKNYFYNSALTDSVYISGDDPAPAISSSSYPIPFVRWQKGKREICHFTSLHETATLSSILCIVYCRHVNVR